MNHKHIKLISYTSTKKSAEEQFKLIGSVEGAEVRDLPDEEVITVMIVNEAVYWGNNWVVEPKDLAKVILKLLEGK